MTHGQKFSRALGVGCVIGACILAYYWWESPEKVKERENHSHRSSAQAAYQGRETETLGDCGVIKLTDAKDAPVFNLRPSLSENIVFGRASRGVEGIHVRINGNVDRLIFLPLDPKTNNPTNNIDIITYSIAPRAASTLDIGKYITFCRFTGQDPPPDWQERALKGN